MVSDGFGLLDKVGDTKAGEPFESYLLGWSGSNTLPWGAVHFAGQHHGKTIPAHRW